MGTKVSKLHGLVVVPGAQVDILFRPAVNMFPAVVQQISIQFEFNK